jgi:2-amino-4-hydroxy-6-hydroxymethyldihydropteridine diphosphokinase
LKSNAVNTYLGLGSNLGDRVENLKTALSALSEHPDIRVIASSSYYETEPVGYKKQGWFINQVIQIETSLIPSDLINATQTIEQQLGRQRNLRWGPRRIDIDILLYSHLTIQTPILTIPHPLLYERNFVLVPLSEIAPSVIHPVLGISIEKILMNTSAKDLVRKI